ncbi:hypothetical protein V6N11_036040 [Hibiscus sabdariffa]|uniref:Uncharacterized protein n=1 Tax=Hibiscus sabdariffa TaxID=183260 RepID=A0ABR2R974_9ROSI
MCRMASSITARGVAVTVVVGPKLGRSIAHKFAHERYNVAILARDLGRLSRFTDEIAREEKARFLGTPLASSTLKPIPWRNLLLFPSSMLSFALNRYQYNVLSNQAEINIHSPYQLFYLTRSNQWKVLSGMVKRRRGTILFTG